MNPSVPFRHAMRLGRLAAAMGILHGCAGTPPATPTPEPPLQDAVPAPTVVLSSEPTAYELRQRERALGLARQGRLAEAALIWELLTTIRPKVAEYRERAAELQRQIDAAASDRLQRAEQAAARGQLDTATQYYLAALALQPDNTKAADALRGLERDRNKRNHLGKLSRNTLTRRAMADAEVATMGDDNLVADATAGSSNTPGPLATGDGNDTEHASLLASQGEWDEAISLLEKRLRTHRRDESARVLLADVYFQQAESLSGRGSRTAAIGLLERSLRTDPSHPRAAERLKQLRLAATASRPATPPIAAAPAASAARTPWVVAVPGNTTTNPVQPAVATVISPAASGTATLLRR